MKKLEVQVDITMTRIDNARVALDNSKSEWAKNYWENILGYMLKVANRRN